MHPTYCYDIHASILHQPGIDHEKLTYRHNGVDRRLTDGHGEVIREIIAEVGDSGLGRAFQFCVSLTRIRGPVRGSGAAAAWFRRTFGEHSH